MTVTESEMQIQLDPEKSVQLDKHPDYARFKDLKAVDFLLLNRNRLVFAEFKSTAPADSAAKSTYLQDALEKYLHSYLLFSSSKFGRKATGIFPKALMTESLERVTFMFVLVVRNAAIEHLPTLQDELQLKMKSLMAGIGRPVAVAVINEAIGRKKGWLV